MIRKRFRCALPRCCFPLPPWQAATRSRFRRATTGALLYGIVDRHDIKQYRELWANKAAVDAVKAGKPILRHGADAGAIQGWVDEKGAPVG